MGKGCSYQYQPGLFATRDVLAVQVGHHESSVSHPAVLGSQLGALHLLQLDGSQRFHRIDEKLADLADFAPFARSS